MNINWCLCPHDFERQISNCLYSLRQNFGYRVLELESSFRNQPDYNPTHLLESHTPILETCQAFYKQAVSLSELLIADYLNIDPNTNEENSFSFKYGSQCSDTNMNPSFVLNYGEKSTTVPWMLIQVVQPWRCNINQPLVPVISHTTSRSPSNDPNVQILRNELDNLFMLMRANNVRYGILTDTVHEIIVKRDSIKGTVMLSLPRPKNCLIPDIFILSLISIGYFSDLEYGRLNDEEARRIASLEVPPQHNFAW